MPSSPRRRAKRGTRGRVSAAPSFDHRVYALLRRVPRGRVVTYGQVAALLGVPRASRAVGRALRTAPEASAVPWHRVVNAAGCISQREEGWADLQRELLELEGVRVRKGKLDLERLRWNGRSRSGAPR